MTRMTLRKISEMSKINKKALLDLDNILQNYKTAEDITLLDRIAKDLNVEEYIADHKAIYFNNVTQQCNHPVYIEECVLALNVFEGCCYADLSLKEKISSCKIRKPGLAFLLVGDHPPSQDRKSVV